MTTTKPKLRKREIALALAAGVMASGAAAIILSESREDDGREVVRIATDRELQLGEFSQLATVGPQDILVTAGNVFSVRLEGNPEAVAQLAVSVENGVLTVEPREGSSFDWSDDDGDVTVHVTAPTLESITLAGSGDVEVDRIAGKSFTGTIAGSGTLELGVVDVEEAKFSIGGSGDVSVAGNADRVTVEVGGSGAVDAEGLQSRTASVVIAGSGEASLIAREKADVAVMGSGDVHIAGPATCSVTKIGSGNVQCDGDQSAD
jgi:hypothetical protein